MMNDNMDKNESGDQTPREKFVLSVDVGTTVLRCHIFDNQADIRASNCVKIELLYPKPGWVEMDPDHLWTQFLEIVKKTIADAKLASNQIAAMGISTQRNTFISWNRTTGKPYHNFITWLDLRAEQDYVKPWNKSWRLHVLKSSSRLAYGVSKNKRMLAASGMEFRSIQIPMRLLWTFDNVPGLKKDVEKGQAMFGLIPTWLIYKLTNGEKFVVDYSNASATYIFDPYMLCWSSVLIKMLNLPKSILPELVDTAGDFGKCDKKLFGASIPISAMVGDQQSAMFGQCCFDIGDVKYTLGTASFININTGSSAHASQSGLYPLVGWKIGEELVYIAEGHGGVSGSVVNWASECGIFDSINETSAFSETVPDSGGVCFVPAFSGLLAPINNMSACTAFMGITPETRKVHLTRALLESIAFRMKQLFDTVLAEVDYPLNYLRADGGVSNSKFIMQLASDIIDKPIDKSVESDMSSLGAAFLAGLAVGFWKSKDELRKLRKSHMVFQPDASRREKYQPVIEKWELAVKRCMDWY